MLILFLKQTYYQKRHHIEARKSPSTNRLRHVMECLQPLTSRAPARVISSRASESLTQLVSEPVAAFQTAYASALCLIWVLQTWQVFAVAWPGAVSQNYASRKSLTVETPAVLLDSGYRAGNVHQVLGGQRNAHLHRATGLVVPSRLLGMWGAVPQLGCFV